jgi:hypothetical protein
VAPIRGGYDLSGGKGHGLEHGGSPPQFSYGFVFQLPEFRH